jgi:hypothetical protein
MKLDFLCVLWGDVTVAFYARENLKVLAKDAMESPRALRLE